MNNYIIITLALLSVNYFLFIFVMFRGLRHLKSTKTITDNQPFFSVIIPFRNEEAHLMPLISSLNKLDYPETKFEILLVDDSSTDNSVKLVNEELKRKNYRVINSERNGSRGHKKNAINEGIKNSCGEIIVTTDADCEVPVNWLNNYSAQFSDDTVLVAGPVMLTHTNSVFERIQSLEFAGLILAGAGLIGLGKPTVCSAANMAYRKKIFIEAGGFGDQLGFSSGDDDLLLQKIAKRNLGKIKYILDRDSLVITHPKVSVDSFMEQRKRWASKSLFYENKALVSRLIFIGLFLLSFPFVLGLSIINPEYWLLFSGMIACKVIPELLVMHQGRGIVYNTGLLRYIFIAELLHIPYLLFAAIGGIFGNFRWKDRKLER